MKKYASCLKIREDIQAPSFQAEIFPPRAPEFRKRVWCGRVFQEEAATKKLIEHLTRRSEAWMACDDGGGVCFNGDFFKKTPEKIQDFIIVSVNYREQESHYSNVKISNKVKGA